MKSHLPLFLFLILLFPVSSKSGIIQEYNSAIVARQIMDGTGVAIDLANSNSPILLEAGYSRLLKEAEDHNRELQSQKRIRLYFLIGVPALILSIIGLIVLRRKNNP